MPSLRRPFANRQTIVEQLAVGDRPAIAGLAFVIVGDPRAVAGAHVPVERVDRRVELAVGEPRRERLVPFEACVNGFIHSSLRAQTAHHASESRSASS